MAAEISSEPPRRFISYRITVRTATLPADAAPRRTNLFATCARREEAICEEVDDTSSDSSMEEWEATEGGGFARVGPGATDACSGEWYVGGFELDMCSGAWRERWRWRQAPDPLEDYERPHALRAWWGRNGQSNGPLPCPVPSPLLDPVPSLGPRRPGAVPPYPGVRDMGVPTRRPADRYSAHTNYHSSS